MKTWSFLSNDSANTTDAIERINIELSIQNKLEVTDELALYFSDAGDAIGDADRARGPPANWSGGCARAGGVCSHPMDLTLHSVHGFAGIARHRAAR